ncbi:zinc ribbon domain-containing protein [Caldivirga sp. UBA161]|uniref:zinc ribbon domain-containing protein n=1 Tax=Caldivirga sp. UBA161 TaxID=1915569 RepID=UPI0025BED154|nr:zinc ribbon domain-containing protein [Caldivirga sp. UBA161]
MRSHKVVEDIEFSELKSIIQRRLVKHGEEFRLVNSANTSKTCSRCSYMNNELALGDRAFKCPTTYKTPPNTNTSVLAR